MTFRLAAIVLDRYLRDKAGDERPWLFPQLVGIAREWLRTCVTYHDDTFPGLLLLAENAERAAGKVWHGFLSVQDARTERILPLLRPYDPTGATRRHLRTVICGGHAGLWKETQMPPRTSRLRQSGRRRGRRRVERTLVVE